MRVRAVVTLTLAGLLAATAGPIAGDDKKSAAPKSSYEHLKILEKSVGSWEGTLTTGIARVPVTSTVEWMLDKQFLKEETRYEGTGKESRIVIVRGWNANAGVMTEHAFLAGGDSGSGTSKVGDADAGKVSSTYSVTFATGSKASGNSLVEFPDADSMVITLTERTLDGKKFPDAKVVLKRKK